MERQQEAFGKREVGDTGRAYTRGGAGDVVTVELKIGELYFHRREGA